MASTIEAIAGVVCTTVGLLCADLPPAGDPDPGEIAPDFYKKMVDPVPVPRVPKPGTLSMPERVDFSETLIGSPGATRTLQIANAGEQDLEITALDISGPPSFTFTGGCPLVRPGASCQIVLKFNPERAGPVNGSLLIGTPGIISRVALYAEGKAPVVVVAPKKVEPKKIIKAKPKPKKKVVVAPPVDPRIAEAISSFNDGLASGPLVFDRVTLLASKAPVPVNELFHLQDNNYEGTPDKPEEDQLRSSFPVERCRIIPTSARIPVVINSPINSQICGAVTGHVGIDVYGPDGRIKLLEMGSQVEGSCEPLEDPDTSRIAVTFHKITRNDGAVINLDKAEGSDAMGQPGLVGEKFDRILDKYGPTAAASTIGAFVAYMTAANTDADGNTVDSPLSAAGEAFNQNIAQIVAEELRNASTRKRRIRIRKGTLAHIKPTKLWYFPNPYQIDQVEPNNAKLTYTCSDDAVKQFSGLYQNPDR